jgi:endonuclease YncB( thermonuclease family)
MRSFLLAVGLLLASAAPGLAATGACTAGGPTCHVQTGRVAFVADGDTIDVRIDGVGERRVRLTGIQAMEQTRYSKQASRRRGSCHALAATARLEQLLRQGHNRVRLEDQSDASISRGRPRRHVSARIGGEWVDVEAILLAEGHVLWLPNRVEWAWNRQYSWLAGQAAAAGLGLYSPAGCAARVASPGAVLSMELNFDAPGNDFDNVNGEWVRVSNRGGAAVDLSRWTFRDSALRWFTFPAGASIPAGGNVTLHMGSGRADANTFYWGLPAPPFENPSGDRRGMGDGGYLFDPQGDLRAFEMYS